MTEHDSCSSSHAPKHDAVHAYYDGYMKVHDDVKLESLSCPECAVLASVAF